jgi:hypothetical protein
MVWKLPLDVQPVLLQEALLKPFRCGHTSAFASAPSVPHPRDFLRLLVRWCLGRMAQRKRSPKKVAVLCEHCHLDMFDLHWAAQQRTTPDGVLLGH